MKKLEVNAQVSHVVEELKHSPELFTWALEELKSFRDHIAQFSVNDERSYSRSFEALRSAWYDYMHQKLNMYDFRNGEPAENTWEKRPMACYWWELYQLAPEHYEPFYDHHCSSRNRQEQMLNLLDDLIVEQAKLVD